MKPLGDALKLPGSRLANEHHGGMAGRFLMVLRNGKYRVKKCKCGGSFAYNPEGVPHCSECGVGFSENASRTQRERNNRLRASKRFMLQRV